MMKKIIASLVALFMLAMSSLAFASTEITDDGTVRAEGIAAADQAQAIGYLGAHIAALRNLLGVVNGVQIDADTTMENLYVTNDVIHAKVTGLIKNAVTVKQFKDETGAYHEIVELRLFGGRNSLADVVIPKVEQKPLPEPEAFVQVTETEVNTTETTTTTTATTTTTTTTVIEALGNYTGVIVDCTGMGLQTAMAPGIYTPDHQVVYGLEHFSHDFVIQNGYVGYSNGFANVSRAGSNPLVVKAVALDRVRPIISGEDATRILKENKYTHFLEEAKVVFVK